MIDFGFADTTLKAPPFSWGAYFEVAGTDEDAEHKYELLEQFFAQMTGWC